MNHIGKIILRIGLSIVFLYFSFNQFIVPEKWLNFLPNFLLNLNLGIYVIYLNAIIDLLIGSFFLFGFFIKFVSILAFFHLLIIIFVGLGINSPSGIRDLGLAFSSLSLFFLKD